MSRLADTLRACMTGGRVRVTRELLEALAEEEARGPCPDCAHERALRAEMESEAARLTAIVDRIETPGLDLAADAASWQQQAEEARADALRYGRERDAARAQLAALREAVREVLDEPHAYVGGRERAILDAALADTAAAAEAHDARVRAEALVYEAAQLDSRAAQNRSVSAEPGDAWAVRAAFLESEANRLRARADEIERGR